MRNESELEGLALCWRMTQTDSRAGGWSVKVIEHACAPSARCGRLPTQPGTLQLLYTYDRRRSVEEKIGSSSVSCCSQRRRTRLEDETYAIMFVGEDAGSKV